MAPLPPALLSSGSFSPAVTNVTLTLSLGSSPHLQDGVPVFSHGPWAIHSQPLAGPPTICCPNRPFPAHALVHQATFFLNMPHFAQIDSYGIPVHFLSLLPSENFPCLPVSLSACPEHFAVALLGT